MWMQPEFNHRAFSFIVYDTTGHVAAQSKSASFAVKIQLFNTNMQQGFHNTAEALIRKSTGCYQHDVSSGRGKCRCTLSLII